MALRAYRHQVVSVIGSTFSYRDDVIYLSCFGGTDVRHVQSTQWVLGEKPLLEWCWYPQPLGTVSPVVLSHNLFQPPHTVLVS